MSKVIMFVFAGRRPNMELQLPFIRDILKRHPNVEYHIWNLSREPSDDQFLRSIEGERIQVFNELYGPDPWRRFDDVYRYYASPAFRHCLFVKTDDDVVFLESSRFGDFLGAVEQNPDSIVSAKVVNNGACTRLEPGLVAGWKNIPNLPLLDVHLSHAFCAMSHNYFLDHWSEMVGQDPQLVDTEDWLSINLIGYNHQMATYINRTLGCTSPKEIAGRRFDNGRLGDEGLINTLPRVIYQGFTACHLYFGPQDRSMASHQLQDLRRRYAEVNRAYLDSIADERAASA